MDTPEALRLAPMQQGMLFDHLVSEDPGTDVVQVQCTLDEPLTLPAFHRAWADTVAAHDALRASFAWAGRPEPLQFIHRSTGLPFEVLDWRSEPSGGTAARLAEFLRMDRTRAFDLTQAPCMRVTVILLDAGRSCFVWSHHHILVDGACWAPIFEEVFRRYDALRQGKQPDLPAARPFADFIAWVHEQDWTRARPYWREALRGVSAATTLPGLPPSPEAAAHNGRRGMVEARIPAEQATSLKAFASERGLTPGTVFLGAWALLLARYNDSDDVMFGVTRACRRSSIPGAESMIGLLINTVPLRVRLYPRRSVAAWLQELRAQWVGMREFEHTPLAVIRECTGLPGDQQLFGTHVTFNSRTVGDILRERDPRWANRRFDSQAQTSFPLSVVGDFGEEPRIKMEFDASRYSAAAAQQALGHFRLVLENLIADPGRPVDRAPMLAPAERRRIVTDWNRTAVDFGEDMRLHRLFEQQARRKPREVAVVFEGERLTYEELDRRANLVAHYLRRRGVIEESLVGICLDPSLELVTALLGLLKAGGAFVPLDPAQPPARLESMVRESRPLVILTAATPRRRLPPDCDCADSKWSAGLTGPMTKPAELAVPDSLAYVIFTSGSTGKPKGAMITHRAAANHVLASRAAFGFTGQDAAIFKSPVTFDPFIVEVFLPLAAGGRLVVARAGGFREPGYLIDLIARHEVCRINLVPSMWREMLEHPELGRCTSLRSVISGGEPLTASLAEEICSRLGAQLYNIYGPAETAMAVTLWPYPRDVRRGPISIGRPLPNTRIYILDSRGEPVPVGVPGELCIGGVAVGRGYLNDPVSTAARFVPDPFADEPGARLFRTGDLARYLPGGDIQFLGRGDDQVKVRGVRVELGEIEACLERHEAVSRAAVVLQKPERGSPRLVAYYTAAGPVPEARELRAWLKQRLPLEMIPAQLVRLAAFPLNANQKIDRAVLQKPGAIPVTAQRTIRGPGSDLEGKLRRIWEETLGCEVGIDDDFFSVGGDSLHAQRVMNRVSQLMGLELPVSLVFRCPSIAELAGAIEEDLADRGRRSDAQ